MVWGFSEGEALQGRYTRLNVGVLCGRAWESGCWDRFRVRGLQI